jgi:hypothetical protein
LTQSPVQLLRWVVSFSNRYGVAPLPSVRIMPSFGLAAVGVYLSGA